MTEITVIGPINGVYHVGYQSPDESKFYSINEFISQGLAQLTAYKMNYDRMRSQTTEVHHGR